MGLLLSGWTLFALQSAFCVLQLLTLQKREVCENGGEVAALVESRAKKTFGVVAWILYHLKERKEKEDRCLLAVLFFFLIIVFVVVCLFWYFYHLMSNPVQEGCFWGENLITPLLTSLYWQGQAGALSQVQSWKWWKERPQLTVSNVPRFIWI